MSEISLQPIRYSVDGISFTGYLADGSHGACVPGILVAHEGPGVGAHVKERALMLARLGFVAFALDLYGAKNPPLDVAKSYVKYLREHPDILRARVAAAHQIILDHPYVNSARTAAVGFCFGGFAALELARSGADLRCVVGFHADLTTKTPDDARNINAKVVICTGADDPIVNADQRTAFIVEMNAAKVDWRMCLYGGVGHSFTNRDIDAYGLPGFAYDQTADERSWTAMRALFDETL
jgi:dienelactone hydrolase